MSRRFFITLVLLAAGLLRLAAQDYPISALDGPAVRADSLKLRPLPLPTLMNPFSTTPGIRQPSLLSAPLNPFETKEQRAVRLNAQAWTGVTRSVSQNLSWYRQPKYTEGQRAFFFLLRLGLSNPYGFKEGYVPLMNPSFPFIAAKTPGMAPYNNPSSPENIPQCIRTEYDFATGTYKQVMVDWGEYQKNLSFHRLGVAPANAGIPQASITPGDRIIR